MDIGAWATWRLIKLLAVTVFAGGVLTAAGAADLATRQRAASLMASPGFHGAWVAGYALMGLSGRSWSPWIVAGVLTSFVALHAAVRAGHSPSPRPRTVAFAHFGLLATVAVMVVRPTSLGGLVLPLAVGAGLAAVTRLTVSPPLPDQHVDRALVLRWFDAVARVEGATLILLMLVAMPLRRLAGIDLDGDTSLLGWTHGVTFVLFVQVLSTTARQLGWSARTTLAALVASVVPFGTFVFEARRARVEPVA